MSNIAYITTKKHVKSYDILSLLGKINNKRFDGKMTISENNYCYKISYSEFCDYLEFYIKSPRKLSCSHPHDPWMSYVFVVFRQELAKLTNGMLSDEGVEETWKPNPKKYPSYKEWIGLIYQNTRKENPKAFKSIMSVELEYAPKGMESY